MRRVASIPFMPGMRTSISTTCGKQTLAQLDRFRSVGGFVDDLDLFLGVENHPEAVADERLIVAEQDADRHCRTDLERQAVPRRGSRQRGRDQPRAGRRTS